jgi:hypothetical protein
VHLMDKKDFARLTRQVLAPWHHEPNQETLAGYWAALHDLPDAQLTAALARVSRERGRIEGQPSPADIRAAAYAIAKDASRERGPLEPPVATKTEASQMRRIIEEVIGNDPPWRPANPAERDASNLFTQLLHKATGDFDRTFYKDGLAMQIKEPAISPAAVRALNSIGGVQGLKTLKPHEVMYAARRFVEVMLDASA